MRVYYPRYFSPPSNIFLEHSGRLMFHGLAGTTRLLRSDFKFDLIHAHVALPDGFAAVMLKEKYRVPVVVTIHGLDLQLTIHKNKKCKEAIGRVFEQADQIVTVSNKLRKIAVNNYGWEHKVTTIANGIHPLELQSPVRGTHQVTLLSVANMIESKGIDLNLRAFAALMDRYPDLVYKIVGDGTDLKRLKGLSVSLGLPGERICFTGRLSNLQVMEQMALSDIFSLPSWQEGFGVAYIEAMSQGKPVIACQGEGIEDVIEHGKNGFLVRPRDLNNLIETLDYLLTNPEEGAAIGAAAKKTVLDHYTWDKNAEKTLSLYSKILGGQPASDRTEPGETG